MQERHQPQIAMPERLLRTAIVPLCPVCESAKKTFSFSAEDHLIALPGVFNYSECTDCGTVFQDPCVVHEDLVNCYTGDYFTHDASHAKPSYEGTSLRHRIRTSILHFADGSPNSTLPSSLFYAAARLFSMVPTVRKRARYGLPDELAATHHDGKCLEVGPGRGTELRLLRQIGWKAIGLDIDPVAAKVAEKSSGCRVHVGSISSADFGNEEFSLIYMNHVMEHLPDLRASLTRCHEWLSAGGRLVLAYPNPRSLVNRMFGRFSPNWDAPRHLVIPPVNAIRQLLEELGFSKVYVTTCSCRVIALQGIARSYRAGNKGWGSISHPTMMDRIIAVIERLAVALRIPAGEEIRVTAVK